jgi:hypothetical protein
MQHLVAEKFVSKALALQDQPYDGSQLVIYVDGKNGSGIKSQIIEVIIAAMTFLNRQHEIILTAYLLGYIQRMASQSSSLCPATRQPHGKAWSYGSCFAQNPRPAIPRAPELIDLMSESESEPELEVTDLEAEVIDLEPEVDLESEAIDLVSESPFSTASISTAPTD